MKSILADFRRSKSAFLTILEALNFDFWKNVTLEMSKVPENSKFRAAQNGKNGIFWVSKMGVLLKRVETR